MSTAMGLQIKARVGRVVSVLCYNTASNPLQPVPLTCWCSFMTSSHHRFSVPGAAWSNQWGVCGVTFVVLPDLDRLVHLGRDETRAILSNEHAKIPASGRRARLNACHFCVEVITRFPIHEAQRSVVVAGDSYVIVIDAIQLTMARYGTASMFFMNVPRAFPLLDIVCRA